MRKRTKEIIEKLNLSQAKFAEEIGMKPQAFSNYLQGRTKDLPSEALRLGREKLNINLIWWIVGEGEMFSSRQEVGRSERLSAEFALLHKLRLSPKLNEILRLTQAIPDSKLDQIIGILKTFADNK
ncbi:helix-turn-helix domain-containing protein [Leptospira weilii]|uniref:helix-turn-helix domain-containing protein n=1 Tax=Leptospira weilii TaxID=28184 RepID=UPI00038127F1|nr:helix-turn-helix transcriptional regulator [Leptospira weilii]